MRLVELHGTYFQVNMHRIGLSEWLTSLISDMNDYENVWCIVSFSLNIYKSQMSPLQFCLGGNQ